LHQKVSEVDDQLNQINENTGKKFLVVKENVIINFCFLSFLLIKKIETFKIKNN